MKTLDDHSGLFLPLQLPIITLATILALFFPANIVSSYPAHWALLPILALLCLNKNAKLKLPLHKKRMPLWKWISSQLFMIFILWSLFIGITYSPFQDASISQLNHLDILTKLDKWTPIHAAFYALLTTSIGYFCYCKKDTKRIQSTTRTVLRNQLNDEISLALDFCFRSVALMNMILSTGIFLLHIACFISFEPLNTGLSPSVLFTFVFVSTILLEKNHRSSMRKLHQRGWHPVLLIMVHLCLIAAIVSAIHHFVSLWLPNANIDYLPPVLSRWLHVDQPSFGLACFRWVWWFGWAPIWAGILLKISGGYSLRSLLLSSTLMIVVTHTLNQLLPFLLVHPTIILVLFSLGITFMLFLMTHATIVSHLTLGIFPGAPYKARTTFPLIRYQTEIAPFISLLALMLGIAFVGWVFWVIELAFYYIMIFAILGLIIAWHKRITIQS